MNTKATWLRRFSAAIVSGSAVFAHLLLAPGVIASDAVRPVEPGIEQLVPPEVLRELDPDILSGKRPTIKSIGQAEIFALREAPKFDEDFVTLSFDDGFRKSFLRTAEIYEKHKLSACLNVIATGHQKEYRPPGQYIADAALGDFALWNELQARGHEIMPHSFKHANLRALPFAEAKDLISRCLDVFAAQLRGFDAKNAVYNFAYNASTPQLEKWLPTRVRAFRTGGGGVNRLPRPRQPKLTCTSFGPAEKSASGAGARRR